MRTLILSCNTGGGHNACARAIQQAFHQNKAECDIIDSLQFASEKLSRFISWGHTTMYRHVPGLFRWGYGFAERHPDMMQEDTAIYRLLSSGAQQLYTFIRDGSYDTLICTHVFSGVLLAQMLREHPIKLKTAFVSTDYTCSPGTAVSHLDRYFIPHESLFEEYREQGIPGDRIIASGIPVDRSFYSVLPKAQAKISLGVDPSHTHLLMMCGSMGCGPLEELVELFREKRSPSMELSIVCGTNERLQNKLEALCAGDPRIHVHGFVSNMSELMDSAELCLIKPGGLSSTEAAVKKLPMVLIDAVAGCEAYNLDFFLRCGGAATADTAPGLISLCVSLLDSPHTLDLMAASLDGFSGCRGAERIFDVMKSL